jgi:hypothetical protein
MRLLGYRIGTGGLQMSHFDIGEWADFARGLVEPSRREAMDAHLTSGCEACGRWAAVLGKTAQVARAEAGIEVPEYAVHCARAIFTLHQPERVRILSHVMSRIVFDSFAEPLPAGVRAQHRLSRQTLYEAGPYALDLRQEREHDASRIALVGQIADRREPGRDLGGLPVVLTSGKSVVATAISNEFGEFHVEYDATRRIRLMVGIESTREGPRSARRSNQKCKEN